MHSTALCKGHPRVLLVTKIARVMQLTALLFLGFALTVSAKTVSQTITFSGTNVPLEKAFAEIKKQAGFNVLYSKDVTKEMSPVTISVKNAGLEQFLEMLLRGKPLYYVIKGNTVSIKRKPTPVLSSSISTTPAAPPVTGIIRDTEGNPVAGVNIVVKGTKRGVVSDAYGNFKIEANIGEVLIISSVNYGTKEIKIGAGNTPLIVALEKNVLQLDEVQYIAYGTTSKRFNVGNVAEVKAADIEKQPINNPLLALQGRVPGVTVMQANGVPGGGITIRIQGRNNLDNTFAGSDPFYVIDDMPYASQNLSTFKGGGEFPILGSSLNDEGASSLNYGYGNPLAFLNAADIESITVLKDAEATAIYGSRAANGAILITTKKGKPGKMKTDINLQQGWGQVPKKMDLLSSQQYMEMRWEAKRNDGRPVNSIDYDLRGVWDTTHYTDWQRELIGNTASFTRLTAGVSGGANNVQYLVSTTYGRETSVFPGDFANTFGSLHFNLSVSSANQRFKLQLGGNYMANINKLPAEDYTSYALNLPPIAPSLYNADGSLNWAPDPVTGNSTWYNPLSRQYNLFETKTNNLVSNGSLYYRILPGFELKSTFGFTSNTSDQFIAALDETEKPESRENRRRMATFGFNTSRSWIIEPQLSFQQRWKKHNLGILLGTTFQYQGNNGRGFTAYGQTTDLLLRDMLAGTNLGTNGVDVNEYRYNAIFGRVNYTLSAKYLVNLSARRDGSSRFGPESQFNNFGALGIGWILSEESFFKHSLPFVSFAKIRGSYGSTGNDQIGNYRFMNLYSSYYVGIPYQNVGGVEPQGLPNPYLEWEETRKLQGGVDLGFWKDRLYVTVSYYRNRSSNSLTTINMPAIAGYKFWATNLPALIQNSGWEFALSTINLSSGSLRWSSSFNFTIPQNKLLEFPGLEFSPLNPSMTIGQPLSTLRYYRFYGVDPLTGVYLVENKYRGPTTKPGKEDPTVFAKTGSRWYGGLQNAISYKGFSIDFLLQFTHRYGNDVLQLNTPGVFNSGRLPNSVTGNQPVSVMDRWQKPGDISSYQRFATLSLGGYAGGNRAYSDISFLRMKNISLSYQIGSNLLQKIKFQQLKIYANAQNVFTITKYRGLDPETLTVSSVPPLRMVTAGLQATF